MLSRVYGPTEEHDLFVRSRYVSDVWGPDGRVSNLPESHRPTDPSLLAPALAYTAGLSADVVRIITLLHIYTICYSHPYLYNIHVHQ